MGLGKKEPVCALVGGPCPRTSDPQAERFCPYWSDAAIVERNDNGDERAVEHCTARVTVRATIQAMKAGHGAAASANEARNEAHRVNVLLGVALSARTIDASPQPLALPDQE